MVMYDNTYDHYDQTHLQSTNSMLKTNVEKCCQLHIQTLKHMKKYKQILTIAQNNRNIRKMMKTY